VIRRWFRWEHLLLASLIIAVFWLRMTLATTVTHLDYDAYPVLREVEHIQQTGTPLRDDPLSVTGAKRVGSPVFEYLLASIAGISPAIYKILPNLFMALLLLPVYFLARGLSGSTASALIAAILAGSGPFVFAAYLNDPRPVPVATLIFLFLIAMLHAPERYLYPIAALSLLLTFIHPIIFLLVAAIGAILILLRTEGFKVDRRLGELFLFTLVLAVWFHVIVYKDALFFDGLRILWKNLPAAYASAAFGNVTLLSLLYGLGVITFLFGVLGAYHALFEHRVRVALGVLGAILATITCLALRVLEFQVGVMLLSLLLSIMAAHGLRVSAQYLMRTKAPWLIYPAAAVLVVLFLLTAVIPSLANARSALANSPSDNDVSVFLALRDTLPKDAVLLTTVREAAAFQQIAGRRTLTDNDFVLVRNGDELLADIDAVYTARFASTISGKAQKLGFTHILFSSDAERSYNRAGILVEPTACIEVSRMGDATIYTVRCSTGGDE